MAKRKKIIRRKGVQPRFGRKIVNSGTNREGMEALGYKEHARGLAIDESVHNLMAHALRRKYSEDFPFMGKTSTDPKLEIDNKLRYLRKRDPIDAVLEDGIATVISRIIFILTLHQSGQDFVFTKYTKKTGLLLTSKVYWGRKAAENALKKGITWKRSKENGNHPV